MNLTLQAAADEVRTLVEATPATAGLIVQVHGSHLILSRGVENTLGSVEQDARVRLTHLGASRYGLSVMRHTGRWERTPFAGSLAEMVETMATVMQHLVAPW